MPDDLFVKMRQSELEGYQVIVGDVLDSKALSPQEEQLLRSVQSKLGRADSGNFSGKIRFFVWLSRDELDALRMAANEKFGNVQSLDYLVGNPPEMITGDELADSGKARDVLHTMGLKPGKGVSKEVVYNDESILT